MRKCLQAADTSTLLQALASASCASGQADKSWAGDANHWVVVDGSGRAKLGEIPAALHAAGITFRDPITDARK
jgi:hypothetical protein